MRALFGLMENGYGTEDVILILAAIGPVRVQDMFGYMAHGYMAKEAMPGTGAAGDNESVISKI
jgi:hypothetical protein